MKVRWSKKGQSKTESVELSTEAVRIGSGRHNEVRLNLPRLVSDRAAVLTQSGRYWELRRMGESDVEVAGQLLRYDEPVIVTSHQSIVIEPFTITVEFDDDHDLAPDKVRELLDAKMSAFILRTHRQLTDRIEDSDDSRKENEQFISTMEMDVEEIARRNQFDEDHKRSLMSHFAAHAVLGHLVGKIIENEGRRQSSALSSSDELWTRMQTTDLNFEAELETLTQSIEGKLGVSQQADISRKVDLIEAGFWDLWQPLSSTVHPDFLTYCSLRFLKKQVKDIVFGFGPLEDLLRLPSISEIMVVSSDKIYVEKDGVLEKSGRRFPEDKVTVSIIRRIVTKVGRRIDNAKPLVDARLADGSRVNAVIAPIAVSGPCLTIRKFPSDKLRVTDLIAKGSFTPTVAEFLRASVVAGKNILISGGTGSGKTTMLNCLSDYIPEKERVVTIEDTAELQLQNEHWVRMETRPANIEGAGEYTIRDLVRNALRMRPDRVVVGECRGAEALDMLQAMNTGHDGSMTTIHANTSTDVVLRLEVLVQMAADLPIHSIHRQIASAVDLVVQLTRMRGGKRCVTQVTEFVSYDPREAKISTKDIFLRDGETADAQLVPTGVLPSFMDVLIEKDLIDLESFYL